MGTDSDGGQHDIPRGVMALMKLLANLNAGVMLALCLWLVWAALDHNTRQSGDTGVIQVQGCGCTLSEVTNWSGRLDVAAHH